MSFTHLVGPCLLRSMVYEWNFDGINEVVKTVTTYLLATIGVAQSGRTWWQIKFLFFHIVMIAYYLSSKMWDRGKTLFMTVFCLMTYPLMAYLSYVSYCGGILFSVWGFMYVDFMRITALALEPSNPFSWSNNTILGVDRSKQLGSSIVFALPANKMVLSAMRINMDFIGWLFKLGVKFLGILDIMHKIGKNSIIMMAMLSVNNLHIVQAQMECTSNNIGRVYSQTIDSLPSLNPELNNY